MRHLRVAIFATLTLTSIVAAVALSLSDRILLDPVKSGAGEVARAGRSAEKVLGVDVLSLNQIPGGPDALGHLLLWGAVGTVACLTATSMRVRVWIVAGLIVLSAAIEGSQPLLSATRSASLSDLAGNGLGLIGGAVVATVIDALARSAWRRWRRDRLIPGVAPA